MFPRNSVFIQHRDVIHTILKELYSNALEHGILEMKSELKAEADGFERYYSERQSRLSNLVGDEIIKVRVSFDPDTDAKLLKILIDDSGEGFDFQNQCLEEESDQYFGRGLVLVRSLCKELKVSNRGTRIEVTYEA